MVSLGHTVILYGVFVAWTNLLGYSLASKKIRRVPVSFRYTEDVEAAASEHGGTYLCIRDNSGNGVQAVDLFWVEIGTISI